MYFECLILFITSCRLLLVESFSVIDFDYNVVQQDYDCPSMCVCDLFMDLNRANCSRQTLIGANIGMSSYVEELDLSHNDITTIDNQCFSHLKQLTTLRLNDNSINYIDLDAFAGLKKLRTVILSRNRLEPFDNRIFEQNPHIFNVNLAENKFMNLPDEPLLKSQSLQILDLQRCKMTNLPVRVFGELPNIRSIDLSGNLLIVLNMGPFMPNEKLRLLNIEENPLRCDAHIELTLAMMRRNRIKVFFRNCPTKSQATTSAMFERMIASPTSSATTTKMPDATLDERSGALAKVWKINQNETCPLNDTKRMCTMYNQCMANQQKHHVNQNSMQKTETEFDITSRLSLLQFVNLNIAFYAGLAIGTVFGMLIVCLMSVIVSKYFTHSKNSANESGDRRNRNRRNRSSVIRAETHGLAEQSHSQLVTSPEHREVVRYNAQHSQRPTNSIFSLFFERPVRHRYCRQLNRSATNLVRRLSQSRLFLNSTRTENANYRNNYSRTNTQESTTENQPQPTNLESESEDGDAIADTSLSRSTSAAVVRSTSMPSMNPEIDDVAAISFDPSAASFEEIRSFASETMVYFERTETPPPPYTDVIQETQTTT